MQSEAFQNLVQSINEIKTQISNQKSNDLKAQWVDIKTACSILNVSIRTLQSYRDKGTLPFSQVEGKIYFKTIDLEAHLNNHYIKSFKK